MALDPVGVVGRVTELYAEIEKESNKYRDHMLDINEQLAKAEETRLNQQLEHIKKVNEETEKQINSQLKEQLDAIRRVDEELKTREKEIEIRKKNGDISEEEAAKELEDYKTEKTRERGELLLQYEKEAAEIRENAEKTILKQEEDKKKQEEKDRQKAEKDKAKKDREDKLKTERETRNKALNVSETWNSTEGTAKERFEAIKENFKTATTDEDGNFSGAKLGSLMATQVGRMVSAVGNLVKKLDGDINSIASLQSPINTRLQGTTKNWQDISKQIKDTLMISPFVSQKGVTSRIQEFVSKGIAYDVEQRAFLAELSGKIATTFNNTNEGLNRLIRIQQQDSTAARLGMESALNTFLNQMYETTEYMSDVMSSIRSSLEEAEALMTRENAVSFDFNVNKWLGSLYSVGVSNTAVSTIGTALGQIASGKLEGITGSGVSNLLVMAAANNPDLNIAKILADGLDESTTNKLLRSMTEFLQGIYTETKDNKVIAQQYAAVFGLSAADLKAISNLRSQDIVNVSNTNLNYSTAMSQLFSMASSMGSRTSLSEMMTNVWDNLQYGIAAGIANNPALYAIYKVAGLLDEAVGGINIPFISAFGTGFDLETTIADLLRVGVASASIFESMGSLISGFGNITGSSILRSFGVDKDRAVARGNGSLFTTQSGTGVSSSGYVGNAEGGDVKNKTVNDASNDAGQQVEAAEEDDTNVQLKDVNENVIMIYQLLDEVTSGARTFYVTQDPRLSWNGLGNALLSGLTG